MPSRDLADLQPEVEEAAKEMLSLCREAGLDVLVTCTVRSLREQGTLYKQGRTPEQILWAIGELRERGFGILANELLMAPDPRDGKIVTMARPGESWHQWGYAFDVVPLRGGKAVWSVEGEDGKMWTQVGLCGEHAGLRWGGRWERFRDWPHFEMLPPGGSLQKCMRGYERRLKEEYGVSA